MAVRERKTRRTSKSTLTVLLEDLCIRLDEESKARQERDLKMDERLQAIEKEIASVKKVIGFLTWILKFGPVIVGIGAFVFKHLHVDAIWNLIPKGRGDKSGRSRRS